MAVWRALKLIVRSVAHRAKVDSELTEELQYHVDRDTERHIAAGMSPEEARREALREFGGVQQTKEAMRADSGASHFEFFRQDLRYGWRMLRKSPTFSLVAISVLALGIGANVAIFTIINAVLLERLPFHDPEQVVAIQENTANATGWTSSVPNFEDYRSRQHTFEELSLWTAQSVNLTGTEHPERVIGGFSSDNFFHMLGVKADRGRLFLAGDDAPEAPKTVILSHATWQTPFGGDEHILGKQLILNGEAQTIIGVLPANFTFPLGDTDVYLNIRSYPNYSLLRSAKTQLLIGRVKKGISESEAVADLNVIAQQLAHDFPAENAGIHIGLVRVKDAQVVSIRTGLLVVMCTVALVLLIACANLAGLLLARGAARTRELAIRAALGASRGRIVRQLVSESLLLSIIGGIAGLFLSWLALHTLLGTAPVSLPVEVAARPDGRVLFFALATSVLTGLIFGTIPALKLSRPNLSSAFAGGSATASAGHTWLRSAFVVGQIALSLVLLVAAGLLVRSFRSLMSVHPGFDTRNLLTMEYRLPKNVYKTATQRWDFHRRMLQHVEHVPGVVSAAVIQGLPFSGNGGSLAFWPATVPPPTNSGTTAISNLVTPGYFDTVGLSVLKGRNFTDSDKADSPTVVVVNRILAAKTWPGEDPIGKELRFPGTSIAAGLSSGPTRATVIGVVPDTKHYAVREALEPQIYFAYSQMTGIFGTLVVKSAADPMSLSVPVRQAVWTVDKDQPVWKIRTLDSLIYRDIAGDRFIVVLMSLFGLLALALTTVGTYGLISYSVAQRTQEIGVRMALGASRRAILLLVMQRAVRLVFIGVLIGVVAAFATTHIMRALLYNVSAVDPISFAAAL